MNHMPHEAPNAPPYPPEMYEDVTPRQMAQITGYNIVAAAAVLVCKLNEKYPAYKFKHSPKSSLKFWLSVCRDGTFFWLGYMLAHYFINLT